MPCLLVRMGCLVGALGMVHVAHTQQQVEFNPFLALSVCHPPPAGISELNWDAIAKHLGRGKRSVQRKYDNLKGSLVHGPPGAAAACLGACLGCCNA